jgi:hypothetical protein
MRVDPSDPDIQYLRAYYGFSGDFPLNQLVTHNAEMKKIYFISEGVSRFIDLDPSNLLNIVNLGVLVFQKTQTKRGQV